MNYPNLHPWKVNIQKAISIQQKLRKKIILSDKLPKIKKIAGVDVAFSDDEAIAAVCIFKYPELNLIEAVKARKKI
ncbi:MAG: endonuclease V, partial [Deltaproteobacteria bacterium]